MRLQLVPLISIAAVTTTTFVYGQAGYETEYERSTFLDGVGWDVEQDPFEFVRETIKTRPPAHHVAEERDDEDRLGKRDWSIPTNGLPPYPIEMWVLENATSWPILANAAVRRMQTWYYSNLNTYDGLSWWQFPVTMASYLDLDKALGDFANEQVVTQILNGNSRGVGYMIDAYVDDQAWWGLILAKASEQYGNNDWLNYAEAIESNDQSWWTDSCNGGLLWLNYEPDYGKNTVTNTLQIALAARLYLITKKSTYLNDALATYNWWNSWAYQPSTGKVYDTYTSSCEATGLQLFTYNSAIIIGALVDLAAGTSNATYLTTASNIAYAAMRDFSNGDGIMVEGCEGDGPPNNDGDVPAANGGPVNDLPAGCQSDTIMFKAILAQNLGYLYKATSDQTIYYYLVKNFLFNAFYNMDSTFLFGEFWAGPFNSTLANQLTQANALGLLSAGVAVNLQYENGVLAAQGLPAATITNSFAVPLPTGNQNYATNTSLRKRGLATMPTAAPKQKERRQVGL